MRDSLLVKPNHPKFVAFTALLGLGFVLARTTSTALAAPPVLRIEFTDETAASVRQAPLGSRVLVFLGAEGPTSTQMPTAVASWPLDPASLDQKNQLKLGEPEATWPLDLFARDELFDAYAVIDFPGANAGFLAPGDLIGPVGNWQCNEENELTIDRVQQPHRSDAPDDRNLVHIECPSPLLAGSHRAWVVLPRGYHDLDAKRRIWPTVHVIPDTPFDKDAAYQFAAVFRQPEANDLVPQAIWVLHEPSTERGHHFFLDTHDSGPRSRAFIEELLPWLKVRFRMYSEPQAHVLLGFERGARAALELFANGHEQFGGVWASAPPALSNGYIGALDLERSGNAFTHANGSRVATYRSPLGSIRDRIHAHLDDSLGFEHALHGAQAWRSGSLFSDLAAAFGPFPVDALTGEIDPDRLERWRANDLLRRIASDSALATAMRERVRVMVGERDWYYCNQGVEALAAMLGSKQIEVVPEADTAQVAARARGHFHPAMIEYLIGEGFAE